MNEPSRIVLMPINGLVNRIRSMASAYILAEQKDLDLDFIWADSEVMNCAPQELFSREFCHKYFGRNSLDAEYEALSGIDVETFFESGKYLILAGGRTGEQAYMDRILKRLKSKSNINTILMKSGGLFHACAITNCSDCKEFQSGRARFYSTLGMSTSVMKEVELIKMKLGDSYYGLHLRQTDKSRDERVSIKRIIRAMRNDSAKNGFASNEVPSVFLCGDDKSGLEEASYILDKFGLNNFFRSEINFNRETAQNAISAYADWLTLSRAKKIFFYGNTSFSYEAAVFGKIFDQSIHLEPYGKKLIWFFQKTNRSIQYKIKQRSQSWK